MKIGLLSDAHGNPTGLRSCLDALRQSGAETIIFLGDAVGYLPDALEVLQELKDAGILCVQGNHEAMLLGKLPLGTDRDLVYQLGSTRDSLEAHWISSLRSWPSRRAVVYEGRRLLLIHGSPWEELTGYVYPDTDLSPFSSLDVDAVMMGNTHRPFIGSSGGVSVMNVGSCGLPRDQGDLASCAIYDTRTGDCEILRIRLNVEALTLRYRNRVHPSVLEVLHRRSPESIVGRIVEQGKNV